MAASICRYMLLFATVVLVCASKTLPQKYRERRHDSGHTFSLMSEVSFLENGDCNIFGQEIAESTCRWILEDEYEHLRDHYWSGLETNPTFHSNIQIHRDGSCDVEGRVFSMDECRQYLGIRHYDHLFIDAFGLPDVDIDDQGYCILGDMELAPEDCPVMVGRAVYTVLKSIHSYSGIRK